MTKTLQVSPDHTLPVAMLGDSTLVIGRKRSGKSNNAVVIVEEALDLRGHVVILDPKGDWWGITSSFDGKHEGYPIVVIGGRHATIPLNPLAGKAIADWIIDTGYSVIVDISELEPTPTERFCDEFLLQLRRRKEAKPGPILLVIDESDELAPQDTRFGAAFLKTLGRVIWMVKRGGFIGIGTLCITQRPASLSTNVRTQTEVLIVLNTSGSQDLDAIEESIKHHVKGASRKDRQEKVADLLAQIVGLAKGEAIVVSGQLLKGISRIPFRRRRTFDSGASPEFGETQRAPKVVARVAVEQLSAAMEKAVADVKANDPGIVKEDLRKARARIVELEKRPPAAAPAKTVEVAVLKNGALKNLRKLTKDLVVMSGRIVTATEHLRGFGGDLHAALEPIDRELARITSVPSAAPSTLVAPKPTHGGMDGRRVEGAAVRAGTSGPQTAPRGAEGQHRSSGPTQHLNANPRRDNGEGGRSALRDAEATPARTTQGITSRQQRFLDAAATLTTLNVEVSRETVSAWLGVHPRGGSVGEELKALELEGYIRMDRGNVTVTDKGFSIANVVSQEQAIASARDALSPRQQRIFDIIVAEHPNGISREAIAERMGIHPRGGSFGEDLGRLRGRGLIEYERGEARARDFLFAGAR